MCELLLHSMGCWVVSHLLSPKYYRCMSPFLLLDLLRISLLGTNCCSLVEVLPCVLRCALQACSEIDPVNLVLFRIGPLGFVMNKEALFTFLNANCLTVECYILTALEEYMARALCIKLCKPRCVCAAGLWHRVQHVWAVGQLPSGSHQNTHAGSRSVLLPENASVGSHENCIMWDSSSTDIGIKKNQHGKTKDVSGKFFLMLVSSASYPQHCCSLY